MKEAAGNPNNQIPIEGLLRDGLADGDVLLDAIGPILEHLVANSSGSLFNDQILAHIRGMAASVATQLLSAQAVAAKEENPVLFVSARKDDLAARLLADGAFLSHCHALTVEMQLAARLERRNTIDPVLSPLLQVLISSDNAGIASSAMAAQARFTQQQNRMEVSLNDLPDGLFRAVLLIWLSASDDAGETALENAERLLRSTYDETPGRLVLLSQLVSCIEDDGGLAALSLSYAGVAIFLSALARHSNQDRDVTAISTNDGQLVRLALSLRAAGLKQQQIKEQFIHIHPDIALPDGFDLLRIDQAIEILAESEVKTMGYKKNEAVI